MSAEVTLLTATPKYLIDNLSIWKPENCMATPDDKPNPVFDQEFCSITISNVKTNGEPDHGVMQEEWSLRITITKRIQAVAYDRVTGQIYLEHYRGISTLHQQIKHRLNNSWKFIRALNAHHGSQFFDGSSIYLDTDLLDRIYTEGFYSPAHFITRTPKLVFRDEDWTHGSHTPDRNRFDGHVAISMSLEFDNLNFVTKYKNEVC